MTDIAEGASRRLAIGALSRLRGAAELGYDEPFRRLWTLWLAMSEAGFQERRLRDVQVLFAKPDRSIRVSEDTWPRAMARRF